MGIILRFFYHLLVVFGILFLLRLIFRVIEFLKMLRFLKIRFSDFMKLKNAINKQKFLLISLDDEQRNNNERMRFILERIKGIAEFSAVRTPYDLFEALSDLRHRTQIIIDKNIRIKMWKKMFCRVE